VLTSQSALGYQLAESHFISGPASARQSPISAFPASDG
jgi:hypothetical protein